MLRHLVRTCGCCALLGSAIASAQTLQVTPGAANYSALKSTISYDVALTYPGSPGAIGLRVVTPPEWTYASTTGVNPPSCLDAVGAKQNPALPSEGFGWFYFTAPSSPTSFRITFTYPASQTGNKTVAFTALVLPGTGAAATVTPSTAVPDLLPPPTPPAITTQPKNATVLAGKPASFSVVATGTSPLTYQWNKGGKAITGATNSTYTIDLSALSDSGSYTVAVTNVKGSVTSTAATLLVDKTPTIGTQPKDTTVAPGANTTLTVKASSVTPLSYQWYHDGIAISGATQASYKLSNASATDTGAYYVQVTNSVDSVGVPSDPVLVQVVPVGMSATHDVALTPGRGYYAATTVTTVTGPVTTPGTLTITNTLTFPTTTSALGWSVSGLPAGFSFASDTTGAQSRPAIGAVGTLEWAWAAGDVKSPLTFTYTLLVTDPTVTGSQTINAISYIRLNGDMFPITVTPDPLTIEPAGPTHSTDLNGDWKIGVDELAQTIALYNTTNNNVRTGAYKYASSGANIGFVSDPTRAATDLISLDPKHDHIHSADANSNGVIELPELMQVLELYNYRAGTTRTGEYHWQVDETAPGSDQYAPGP